MIFSESGSAHREADKRGVSGAAPVSTPGRSSQDRSPKSRGGKEESDSEQEDGGSGQKDGGPFNHNQSRRAGDGER